MQNSGDRLVRNCTDIEEVLRKECNPEHAGEIGINTRNLVNSAQDMDFWRVLVNVTFKLQDPLTFELISVVETTWNKIQT